MRCARALFALGAIGVFLAAVPWLVGQTVWWAGYDIRNCLGCEPNIDWSHEGRHAPDPIDIAAFRDDGVVVLNSFLDVSKVSELAKACDELPNSFMTSVLARVALPQYLRYEHKVDTRSAIVRDWAVHGPLGRWAAELMGVDEVRLYNAEIIFHRGADAPACTQSWHRDTIAAPFAPGSKAVVFNVLLEDINADGDGLIYQRGSHKSIDSPVPEPEIVRPSVRVGDLLAHDPNVYHTPSGEGCWRRRGLQFRYVEGGVRFSFGPGRLPHGFVPWSLAHASLIAPHGLSDGDLLEGPWYPRVFPAPLPAEHAPVPGPTWSLTSALRLAGEAEKIARVRPNATPGELAHNEDAPPIGFFGLDGPVADPADWTFVQIPGTSLKLPFHKHGPGFKEVIEPKR